MKPLAVNEIKAVVGAGASEVAWAGIPALHHGLARVKLEDFAL
jgi:hypothetical protein